MQQECGTLLIAECGCGLAAALAPWLAEKGCKIKVVDNLKDMLMTIQEEKVNVLVMDVSLREAMAVDIISVVNGLKRHLPIIVTTEVNNPEQESLIRRKGIFYYHVKSFGMDELTLAISNAMARSSRSAPSSEGNRYAPQ